MKKIIGMVTAGVIMSLAWITLKHFIGFENAVLIALACIYIAIPNSK